MNRFRIWSDRAAASPTSTSQLELTPASPPEQRDLYYSLFAPHHYEPNYAYPLLVWLHGPRDDEREVCRIMPHLSTQNYVAVGPRGCCPEAEGQPGFCWCQEQECIDQAEQRVLDSIELACARYHVSREHVFLAGYECGGTMALRIGLQHPQRFAGALSIGGPFPTGLAPLARLRQARQLPLLIAQGKDSVLYPLELTCSELRLFHAAAMHVTLRQYPCSDELTTQMLSDMNSWMMEQVTGVRQTVEEDSYASPRDVMN
jgi:phospholipase/carboxylesterase